MEVAGERFEISITAMKSRLWITGLLFACMSVPFLATAQTQQSSNVVSIRELSIPPKALRAFEQGMEQLAKKDPAASLPYFQRAISEYAGYYEAYDRLGAADLKLWRVPEAEQAFRKAIEVSAGQYAHPLLALGAILDEREAFAEAESVTRKGLNLDPNSWTGRYYLALALLGLNRLADAENSVREALRRKTDFPQGHLLLAEIHSREQDFPSLVSDLDEYLKLSPDGPASARAKALRESAQGRMIASQGNTTLAQPQ
jgi:tetratricopeptide (TPR) repeat protein